MARKDVILAEYLVHWAGWPSECDSWVIAQDNISSESIATYHAKTDPYRDVPMDAQLSYPETLFMKEDQWPKCESVEWTNLGRAPQPRSGDNSPVSQQESDFVASDVEMGGVDDDDGMEDSDEMRFQASSVSEQAGDNEDVDEEDDMNEGAVKSASC